MRLLIILIFTSCTTIVFGQDKKIAITVDDVPCSHCKETESIIELNQKLISTLKKYDVPAIGFVNEEKLYHNDVENTEMVNILKAWLDSGLELGNHTYSHIYINSIPIKEYKKEIIEGEKITKPLMRKYGMELKYFRHTQLRTGPTTAYRLELSSFLDSLGYTVAPVTIDNDEYIYAYSY